MELEVLANLSRFKWFRGEEMENLRDVQNIKHGPFYSFVVISNLKLVTN